MSLTIEQHANMEKWLEKLEGGTYNQAGNALKYINTDGTPAYCCLGVAAEAVLGRQFLPLSWASGSTFGEKMEYQDDNGYPNRSSLATSDKKKLGLNIRITEEESKKLESLMGYLGGLQGMEREYACILMNDELHMNFKDIANVIREMGWY